MSIVIDDAIEVIEGRPVVFATSLIALAGITDMSLEVAHEAGVSDRGVLLVSKDNSSGDFHCYLVLKIGKGYKVCRLGELTDAE